MLIDLEHVHKRFGDFVALRDLSLGIEEGTTLGLLGPNGAGKTTLLRIIMGLLPLTSGRVRLLGEHAPGDKAVRGLIGYMPQSLSLYPALTVRENIEFYGRIYGVDAASLAARANELIALTELQEKSDARAETLSGGMARRAMLATALVHRPKVLILDEPTAGVDPLLRLSFWRWFDALASEGTTIIVTTHHIAEASECREVLFLREGALLDRGSPAELTQRYEASDLEQAFVEATRKEANDT